MHKLVYFFTITVLAAVLSACGVGRPRELSMFKGIRRQLDPVNSGILIAPPFVSRNRTPAGKNAWNLDSGMNGKVGENPLEGFQDGLADALRKYSCFRVVDRLLPVEASTPEMALQKARERKADFLLKVNFNAIRTAYKGTNGHHVPNCALWFLFECFSWFVADEVYSGEIAGNIIFTDVEENKVVQKIPFQVNRNFDLDDFQRGLQIWGIMRVPGSLDQSSGEKIGRVVMPHVLRRLEADILKYLQENRTKFIKARWSGRTTEYQPKPPVEKPPVEKPPVVPRVTTPENYALVVGISRYKDNSIPDVKYAENDAESMGKLFSGGSSPLVKSGNVTRLTGSNATKAKIAAALEKLAAKPEKELDTVYIYFAGCGATSPDGEKKYLVVNDTNPSDLDGTALNLSWFMTQFAKLQTKKVFVVIDAGFAATGGGRSLKTGRENTGFDESLLLSFVNFPGALLLAAKGAETAFELDDEKNGIFTYYFLEGFSSDEADEDQDGRITLSEAYEFARENVSFQVRTLRGKQNPEFHGKGKDKIRLPEHK